MIKNVLPRTSQSGFGLMELMVTVGLASLVSMVIGTVMYQAVQSEKAVTIATDSSDFMREISTTLANESVCSAALAGKNAANTPPTATLPIEKLKRLESTSVVDAYQTKAYLEANSLPRKMYGASKFEIISYALKEGNGTAVANNSTELHIVLNSNSGVKNTLSTKSVRMFVSVDASGNIVKCRGLGGFGDIFVKPLTGTNTYYNTGRLAIGTDSSLSPLNVSNPDGTQLLILDSNSAADTSSQGGTLISSTNGLLSFRGMSSAGALPPGPTLSYNQVNSYIGIGTETPTAALHIAMPTDGPGVVAQVTNPAANSNPLGITFMGSGGMDMAGIQFKYWDGTAGNVGVTFSTRQSGWLASGYMERMRISPDGKFGSSMNPGAAGSAIDTNTYGVSIKNYGNGSGGWYTFRNTNANNSTTIRLLNDDGSADFRMSTYPNTGPDSWRHNFFEAAAGGLNFSAEDPTQGRLRFYTNQGAGFCDSYMNNCERVRITESGGIGIGTLTPTEAIEIAGNALSQGYKLPDSGAASWGTNSISGSATTNDLIFNPNGGEQARINSNGYVGIGTNDPRASLDVAGSLRIGNDTAGCNSSKAGSIRYTASTGPQLCDSTAWGPVDSYQNVCLLLGGTWTGSSCTPVVAPESCDCSAGGGLAGGGCPTTASRAPSGSSAVSSSSNTYMCVTGNWVKIGVVAGPPPPPADVCYFTAYGKAADCAVFGALCTYVRTYAPANCTAPPVGFPVETTYSNPTSCNPYGPVVNCNDPASSDPSPLAVCQGWFLEGKCL